MIEVEIRGLDRFDAMLRRAGVVLPDAGAKGLFLVTMAMYVESQGQVPARSGALLASGFVRRPERSGNTWVTSFGYSGPAAYARQQHWRDFLHHRRGKAMFVRDPMRHLRSRMAEAATDEIRKAIVSL